MYLSQCNGKILCYRCNYHCVKSVFIWSYSGPHFSRISPHSEWIRRDMDQKNADQNNSEYGLILRSVFPRTIKNRSTVSELQYCNGLDKNLSSAISTSALSLENEEYSLKFLSISERKPLSRHTVYDFRYRKN